MFKPALGTKPANAGAKYNNQALTDDEVRRMLAATTCSDLGVRNRLMLLVLWQTGVRVAELLALRVCDIDPVNGLLTVVRGKNGDQRTIGISDEVKAAFALWCKTRDIRGIHGGVKLFCNLKGEPVKAGAVRILLQRLADKAGIQKRVHPHGMRYSFASALARDGMPTYQLCKLMGHKSSATTDSYLNGMDVTAIKAAQQKVWG